MVVIRVIKGFIFRAKIHYLVVCENYFHEKRFLFLNDFTAAAVAVKLVFSTKRVLFLLLNAASY